MLHLGLRNLFGVGNSGVKKCRAASGVIASESDLAWSSKVWSNAAAASG